MTGELLLPIDDVVNMFSVDDYMYFYSDYLDAERSNNETAMAARLLGMTQEQPLRVLDLACGFGRIANRLALLGHNVTGVEYQAGFLEIARSDARRNDLLRPQPRGWVEYVQGDMRTIAYHETFDRAIMMFNSFGYFTDEENLRVLRNIARALKPGGLLGFDIANRDGVLNDFHPHYVSEKDGSLLINRFSFDVLTGRLRNDRIVIRNGERRDRPFSIRLYSVTEMRGLLAEAGLELGEVYAEWDGSPLMIDSPAMVLVARK
ncbi:MAG: methyltransferase domain-containing protein [Anaerolineae bacterium]|nr:methyltransferase domain-containing protein [Anaerolineae bacterium]